MLYNLWLERMFRTESGVKRGGRKGKWRIEGKAHTLLDELDGGFEALDHPVPLHHHRKSTSAKRNWTDLLDICQTK